MSDSLRFSLVLLLMFAVITVDFASKFLSIVVDGALVTAALCILFPLYRKDRIQ
ncbi:DUF3927 family protein [Photobacterium ganghwense]|uniref:DUF3927 family protein n=1 Tax=Photobacterium ganghwense TaxID=320778 RepID=UPI0039EF5750